MKLLIIYPWCNLSLTMLVNGANCVLAPWIYEHRFIVSAIFCKPSIRTQLIYCGKQVDISSTMTGKWPINRGPYIRDYHQPGTNLLILCTQWETYRVMYRFPWIHWPLGDLDSNNKKKKSQYCFTDWCLHIFIWNAIRLIPTLPPPDILWLMWN